MDQTELKSFSDRNLLLTVKIQLATSLSIHVCSEIQDHIHFR